MDLWTWRGKERLGQIEKVALMYIHSLTLKVTQMCLTLWEPMDCSPPGSSVHGISQAKILEWVAIPISRRSSQSRDQTWVSFIAGRFFTIWTTKEAPCMLITCGRLLYSTGSPTWSLWWPKEVECGPREAQEGKGIYTYISLWLINIDVWQRAPHHCKAITLQFKDIYKEREAGGGCRWEQPVWGISVEGEGPSSLETAVMAEAISDSVKA